MPQGTEVPLQLPSIRRSVMIPNSENSYHLTFNSFTLNYSANQNLCVTRFCRFGHGLRTTDQRVESIHFWKGLFVGIPKISKSDLKDPWGKTIVDKASNLMRCISFS